MRDIPPGLLEELSALRRSLHAAAEPSGEERETSAILLNFLRRFPGINLIHPLAETGLAAVFHSPQPGKTILLRAEMDALPIPEATTLDYASRNHTVSHKCGHDGHMAMLAGTAALLTENPPAQGSVQLLFQPSEENGCGARKILADPLFPSIPPDFAFALHCLPGFPLATVILKEGLFAFASSGFIAELRGVEAHAAEPEKGINPLRALVELISHLNDPKNFIDEIQQGAKITIVYAKIGEKTFGTSPAAATVMATLRAPSLKLLHQTIDKYSVITNSIGQQYEIIVQTHAAEEFKPSINHHQAVALVRKAAKCLNLKTVLLNQPFLWSEDFSRFLDFCPGALIGLGAGENIPPLHHPDFDFPDELIEFGTLLNLQIAECALGE